MNVEAADELAFTLKLQIWHPIPSFLWLCYIILVTATKQNTNYVWLCFYAWVANESIWSLRITLDVTEGRQETFGSNSLLLHLLSWNLDNLVWRHGKMSFPLCVKPSNALSKCLKIWCSSNTEFTQKPSNKMNSVKNNL